jgi:TRAP-type uncharacterized transport system substrate-binding protein
MRRLTTFAVVSSIVSCIYTAGSWSNGAVAQIDSDRSRALQQTVGSVREARMKYQSATQARQTLRQKMNSGLVAILIGESEADSSDLFEISQLFTVLEREDFLRVFQLQGRGALQNVIELAFARGIDAGIIQSDTLAFLNQQPLFPGMDDFLRYVAKLSDKEVHVLAASNISSIEDLKDKKVNFGPRHSENSMTAAAVFDNLKIKTDPMELPHAAALDKLKRGEIDAMVYVATKPANLFQSVTPEDKVHFLPIPASGSIKPGFSSVLLGADDYPQSIEQGRAVETLAVGSILVVYNWPRGTERHRNVARFVTALLDELHSMKTPAHPPRWRDMDVTAPVPGWARFAPADEWIKIHTKNERGHPSRQATVLPHGRHPAQLTSGNPREPLTDSTEMNELFADFLKYAQQQGAVTRTASKSVGISDELKQLFTDFLRYQNQKSMNMGDRHLFDAGQLNVIFAEFADRQGRLEIQSK